MPEPTLQHYISRIVTKPWEIHGRQLRYFDFSDNLLKIDNSKNLFARKDLWNRSYEALFDKTFERSLNHEREKLLKGQEGDGTFQMQWEKLRSVVLLILFHIVRIQKGVVDGNDAQEMIEEFTATKYDQLAQIFLRKYTLVRVRLFENQVLCFPQTGLFAFPLVSE